MAIKINYEIKTRTKKKKIQTLIFTTKSSQLYDSHIIVYLELHWEI